MSLADQIEAAAANPDGAKIELDMSQQEAEDFLRTHRPCFAMASLRSSDKDKIDIALERIVAIVTEQVSSRLFRAVSVVLTVLTIIGGVAATAYIGEVVGDEFREQSTDFADKVGQEVRQQFKSDIESAGKFQQLTYLALSLDIKQGFTAAERDSALRVLRSIQEDNELRSRNEFLPAMEKVLDSFIAADQRAAVDEIYTMFRQECLSTGGILTSMLEHYGRRIAGQIEPPDDATYDRFKEIANAAVTDLPGGTYAYRIVADFRRTRGRSKLGEDLWRAASKMRLTPGSAPAGMESLADPRVQFCGTLLAMTHERILAKQPTPETAATVELIDKLLSEYQIEFGRVLVSMRDDGVGFDGIKGTLARSLGEGVDSFERAKILNEVVNRINLAIEAAESQ